MEMATAVATIYITRLENRYPSPADVSVAEAGRTAREPTGADPHL